jgi:hypothetical protein
MPAAECARRKRGEPGRDGGSGDPDDDPAGVVRTHEGLYGNSGERNRENGEERSERVPLHGRSVVSAGAEPCSGSTRPARSKPEAGERKGERENALGTLAHRHRGVAQLVERRSPKP